MQPGSNSAIVCSRLIVYVLAAAAVNLAGCGGSAMLKEPQPLVSSTPLAEAKDDRILASIDTVIFRNGPGAWARDAELYSADAFSIGVECKSWSGRFGAYWTLLITGTSSR